MLTITGIIITIIGIIVGIPPFIEFINLKREQKNKFKQQFPKLSFSEKIVMYIWNFPTENENQYSWAVKESQVILGNLEVAKKKPGLGIAILSIEFALKYFKDIAENHINNCINWGIIRTQTNEPHFILYEKYDESISKTIRIPDFRHTIALGIILTKTKKKPDFIGGYVKYLLDNQHNDGGWTAGQGHTTSELFSCIYAIELLLLNKNKQSNQNSIEKAVKKAINWLIENISNNYLWKSNVFDEYWDMLFTSTWVLNRLIPLKLDSLNENWYEIVNSISSNILDNYQRINWDNKDKFQKFRIEARISAALHKGIKYNYYKKGINGKVESFIQEWKIRTENFLNKITYDDLDLATSLFIAEPLLGNEKINFIVENKLKKI